MESAEVSVARDPPRFIGGRGDASVRDASAMGLAQQDVTARVGGAATTDARRALARSSETSAVLSRTDAWLSPSGLSVGTATVRVMCSATAGGLQPCS